MYTLEITKRDLNDSIDDQSLGNFTTKRAVKFLGSLPTSDLWLYYMTVWDEDEFCENIAAEEWLEDQLIIFLNKNNPPPASPVGGIS